VSHGRTLVSALAMNEMCDSSNDRDNSPAGAGSGAADSPGHGTGQRSPPHLH
jgi:hypothetical protein